MLFGDRTLALVMVVAFASLLFMTASASAELFFATDVLDVGESGYGLLMTAWTTGMLVARRIPAAALVPVVLAMVALSSGGSRLRGRPGEVGRVQAGCEIQERAGDGRDGDAVPDGHVEGGDPGAAVDRDPRPFAPRCGGHGDLGFERSLGGCVRARRRRG